TVHCAYSTATSREKEMPPIAYEVRLAFDGKTYHLCSLRSLERKQEFSDHPLYDKRQQSSEGLIFDELCENASKLQKTAASPSSPSF
ncbi:MAG: hypothetical protein ACREVJ_09295, partial [Gammaproteobacteria bacterium]